MEVAIPGSGTKMQRARGQVRLAYAFDGQSNRLSDLHQSGCYKLMLPRNHQEVPDAVLINTAGGLTGGDKLNAAIRVGDGASLRAATQTAERVYKSTGSFANIDIDFEVGEDAHFDWLAQETIVFEGGQLHRKINANLSSQSSSLFVEPVTLGRTAMGERIENACLKDSWRFWRDSELIFADESELRDFSALRHPAGLGDNIALASILLIEPEASRHLKNLREATNDLAMNIGFSAWNDMLLCRMMSQSAKQLRNTVAVIYQILRGREMPRVWTM